MINLQYQRSANNKKCPVADTGASKHFFEFAHTNLPVTKVRQTKNSISVLIPNGESMLSTNIAELDIPNLPPQAK